MNQCWIQISAGKGPEECSLAVKLTLEKLMKEAHDLGCTVDVLESTENLVLKTIDSVLLNVRGLKVESLIKNWSGTIQWNCQSPFRPTHKRKNWFISVNVLNAHIFNDANLNEKDIVFESMRSTGAGGQHINKTNSAIRATHKKLGIVVTAREERSQFMNKKLALAKIASIILQRKNNDLELGNQLLWKLHQKLERGNPKRTFYGVNFEEKNLFDQ